MRSLVHALITVPAAARTVRLILWLRVAQFVTMIPAGIDATRNPCNKTCDRQPKGLNLPVTSDILYLHSICAGLWFCTVWLYFTRSDLRPAHIKHACIFIARKNWGNRLWIHPYDVLSPGENWYSSHCEILLTFCLFCSLFLKQAIDQVTDDYVSLLKHCNCLLCDVQWYLLKRSLILATAVSIVSTVAWRIGICDARKNKYAAFYKGYDPQKDFEAMKSAGVFTSVLPDGTVGEGWWCW